MTKEFKTILWIMFLIKLYLANTTIISPILQFKKILRIKSTSNN